MHKQDPTYDSRPVIQFLMKLKKCRSIFELITLERQDVIDSNRVNKPLIPILTWTVANLTNCFYKQSDTFQIEGAQWRLAVSYFKQDDPALKVEMKLINNPYDVKQNKSFFKQKDFDLPCNRDESRIDPFAQYEVEQDDYEKQEQRADEMNAFALDYPNHTFVTFLSAVRLNPKLPISDPQVSTLICSGKSPTELHRFENFD